MTYSASGPPKCSWCYDRPGGCMMCNTPAQMVATGKTVSQPTKPASEVHLAHKADPTPEAKTVEEEHPASAWDTSTDYGPREPKPDPVAPPVAPPPPPPPTGKSPPPPSDDDDDEFDGDEGPSGFGSETPTRADDPSTSFDAAASVSDSTLQRTYRAVLMMLDRAPSTLLSMEDAIEAKSFGSRAGTRTRTSVLVDWGYAENTGKTAIGRTGRKMRLWGITDKGRMLLEKMNEAAL